MSFSGSGNNVTVGALTSNSNLSAHLKQFHELIDKYKNSKANEALCRSAKAIRNSFPAHYLVPDSPETSKFYIDLHTLIRLSQNTDLLRECLHVLNFCSRNLKTRDAIIYNFNFIPSLTLVLKETRELKDQELIILSLLQNLTYGINITWDEPYLNVLIELLIGVISKKEPTGKIAITILVNLLYKNLNVLFLFLRSVDIFTFTQKISFYGVHATKILIILSKVANLPEVKEINIFLRSHLNSIDGCLKVWNAPCMRHLVDFILDCKSHKGLHSAVLEYEDYCDNIGRYLEIIDSKKGIDDSTDDNADARDHCLSALFQLIQFILQLSESPYEDETESPISLDANIPRIYELARTSIGLNIAGIDAINVLQTILSLSQMEHMKICIDSTLIEKLVQITENAKESKQSVAVLKLLLTLINKPKIEKLILSKISETFFNKMLTLSESVETLLSNNSRLNTEDIEKFILCLLLLIKFGGIAKKTYYKKCCSLLQMTQLQVIMACAIAKGNETTTEAVFEIAQFDHFPKEKVSEFVSQLTNTTIKSHPVDNHALNIARCNQLFNSKQCEERINSLINLITEADRNNQLKNITVSHVIELYNYRMNAQNISEFNLKKRLEDATNEIMSLSHVKSLQMIELEKFSSTNEKLLICKEKLETQCNDLNQQENHLKTNVSNLLKKISEQSESLRTNEKHLEELNSELIVLKKDHAILQKDLSSRNDEIERLEAASRENVSRIEKLKKTIIAYETNIKETAIRLEEKERDILKTTKSIHEMSEAKKKSEDIISLLEAELQEKNEKIRKYEMELNETEEIQKKILSIMESKRVKRKK